MGKNFKIMKFIGVTVLLIGAGLAVSAEAVMRRQRGGLATTGPYALTRNPVYVGAAFAYLGLTVALHAWWAIAGLAVAVVLTDQRLVAREERELTRAFGDDYRHYVATTPRWLVAKWRAR